MTNHNLFIPNHKKSLFYYCFSGSKSYPTQGIKRPKSVFIRDDDYMDLSSDNEETADQQRTKKSKGHYIMKKIIFII